MELAGHWGCKKGERGSLSKGFKTPTPLRQVPKLPSWVNFSCKEPPDREC